MYGGPYRYLNSNSRLTVLFIGELSSNSVLTLRLSFWGAPDPALCPGLTQNAVPKALGTYFSGKHELRAPGYRLVPCARPKLRHLILPSLELKTVPRYLPEGKISSKRKHRSTIGMPGLRPALGVAASMGRGWAQRVTGPVAGTSKY